MKRVVYINYPISENCKLREDKLGDLDIPDTVKIGDLIVLESCGDNTEKTRMFVVNDIRQMHYIEKDKNEFHDILPLKIYVYEIITIAP